MDSLGSRLRSAEWEEKAYCLLLSLFCLVACAGAVSVRQCGGVTAVLVDGHEKVLVFNSVWAGVYAFLEAVSVFSLEAF